MSHANTRWLHDDRTWYADIPGLNGVWATGISERACREELRTVLEEWLALGLRLGHPIPEIDGVTVTAELGNSAEIRPNPPRDLIRYLLQLGFDGPQAGGRHQFMVRGELRVRIPNPHQTDIGRGLLAEILSQIDVSRDEWEQL